MVLTGTLNSPGKMHPVQGPTGPLANKLPLLAENEKKALIEESKKAFYHRRRIQISGLPPGTTSKEISQNLLKSVNVIYVLVTDKCIAHALLINEEEAEKAMALMKGKVFKGNMVHVSYSQCDFMLFVGNIPYSHSATQFQNMMKSFGEIERLILVRSEKTGQSKGYGFVEFTYKSGVEKALSDLKNLHKSLRVDLANPGLNEYYDLQSQTLFVSQFPPSTKSEQIEEIVDKHVQVPFCKIPLENATGKHCNYALVDCKSPEDAEMLWKKLDGCEINGGTMRVSFSSPGRLAATLLGGQDFGQRNKADNAAPKQTTNAAQKQTQVAPPKQAPALMPRDGKTPVQPRFPGPKNLIPGQEPPRPRSEIMASRPPRPRSYGPLDIQGQGMPRAPFVPGGSRPPQNLLNLEPRGRFDARGPQRMLQQRGPARSMGPRGVPSVFNARGPQSFPNGRGPRVGPFRGESRAESPRFQGDKPFEPRGIRPGSRFPEVGRGRPLGGRIPNMGFQRPPRPKAPFEEEINRRDLPPEDRFVEQDPYGRDLSGQALLDQRRELERDEPPHPLPRFDVDRRRSPEREAYKEDERRGELERPWSEKERTVERHRIPGRMDSVERPPWAPDRHLEREPIDKGRGDWSRQRTDSENEQHYSHGSEIRRLPQQQNFADERGHHPRDRPTLPWDHPERSLRFEDKPIEVRRRGSPLSHELRRGRPQEHDGLWSRDRSPPKRPPQFEHRDIADERPPFPQRAPWTEAGPARGDFEERHRDEPWSVQDRGEPLFRRHDEPVHDIQRESRGYEEGRFQEDRERARFDEDNHAYRFLLDGGQPQPHEDSRREIQGDYAEHQRRNFDPSFRDEGPPHAKFTPGQGPPPGGHFEGRPPHDRQPQTTPRQPSDAPPMQGGDFVSNPGMPPPRFQPPSSFQEPSQPQSQNFPPPPWQQQSQQPPFSRQEQQSAALNQPQFTGQSQPQMHAPFPMGSSGAAPPTQPQPTSLPVSSGSNFMQPIPLQSAPHHQAGFLPQSQQASNFMPSTAPVMTTSTANTAFTMPAMPGMTSLQMPTVPVTNLMPAAGGAMAPQAGVQAGVPQIPTQAAGTPAPQQGTSSQAVQPTQLDAYVAAASAAQQYAQYYEQLAKQQEAISQQPSAPGSKDAASLATQAKAYARYYQQYYQHMQSILQMTKMQQVPRPPQPPGSVAAPAIQTVQPPLPVGSQPPQQQLQPLAAQPQQVVPSQQPLQQQVGQQQQQYPSSSQIPQSGMLPGAQISQPGPFQQQSVPAAPWHTSAPPTGTGFLQTGMTPGQQGGAVQPQQQMQQQQLSAQQGAVQANLNQPKVSHPGDGGFQHQSFAQQPWPTYQQNVAPQHPTSNQVLSQRPGETGGLPSQPPVNQHQQSQRQDPQLHGQQQNARLQQQQQQRQQSDQMPSSQPHQQNVNFGYQLPPHHAVGAQHAVGQMMGGHPMTGQPGGQPPIGPQPGGHPTIVQQPGGLQPGAQQPGDQVVQGSLPPSGMNWMYSVTKTTDSVRPQHFAKPVLYTSPSAPRDQAGSKRHEQGKSVYDSHKRPRY